MATMPTVRPGDQVPDFDLPAHDGRTGQTLA
jgi:peroxiredoxin